MSYLLEYRKINDINVPLFFKFGIVLAKDNITADKLLTLENWMKIFEELNPLLASDPNTSRKSKTFEMDSGRLSVRARWAKISDSSDMGTYIVKILSLSSSNVGKYFLKIDVKLSSYLERIALDLEQKSKSLDVKNKSKESSHDVLNTSKHKKSTNRKISDMLPKIKKEKDSEPPTPSDESAAASVHESATASVHESATASVHESAFASVLEELIADDMSKVEEYIPLPKLTSSATALSTTDTFLPTYTPEKCIKVEMNAFQSEYSPTSMQPESPTDENAAAATYDPEKKLSQIEMNKIKSEYSPTCKVAQPNSEEIVYKPTKKNKSSDNGRTKKILNKSKELFGSSDENSNDAIDKVSSSSQKSKRKMDASPRREQTSSKEKQKTKSKKKKTHDDQSSQESVTEDGQESVTEDGQLSIRNVMTEPIDAILATYPDHQLYLQGLYAGHVKKVKRSYKAVDIPDMAALDIVTSEQFTAMIDFLEQNLVGDVEEEHNYSDIIFDLLIPEWALGIFCKRFYYSRSEALERLRLQAVALSNSSDL